MSRRGAGCPFRERQAPRKNGMLPPRAVPRRGVGALLAPWALPAPRALLALRALLATGAQSAPRALLASRALTPRALLALRALLASRALPALPGPLPPAWAPTRVPRGVG